jgi:NitT/TauT family transport system substrate-binding protein
MVGKIGFRRRIAGLLPALAAVMLAGAAGTARAAEIKVGFIPVVGIAQLFVMEGEGWAREAGLELKLTQFESGPAMISALASGTLDAYYGGIGPIMVAASRGVETKVVAATAVEEMAVVARGDLAARLGTDLAQGFKTFAQTQGRPVRIGTQPPGSVPDTVLRYWLETVVKADAASVQIVGMGIEQTQQALLAGAIDAASIREPTLTLVLERDPSMKLLALGGEMMPNQPGSVLAVSGGLLRRDAEAVAKLVALHVRATRLLREEPARAAIHLQKELGKGMVPVATFERALISPASKFAADPNQIKAATALMQDFQLRLGVLKAAADLDALFDDQWYRRAAVAR